MSTLLILGILFGIGIDPLNLQFALSKIKVITTNILSKQSDPAFEYFCKPMEDYYNYSGYGVDIKDISPYILRLGEGELKPCSGISYYEMPNLTFISTIDICGKIGYNIDENGNKSYECSEEVTEHLADAQTRFSWHIDNLSREAGVFSPKPNIVPLTPLEAPFAGDSTMALSYFDGQKGVMFLTFVAANRLTGIVSTNIVIYPLTSDNLNAVSLGVN